jgi:hypothetical protein
MRRTYQKRSAGRSGSGRTLKEAVQLMLDPVELIRQMQESVHTLGVEIGRMVASKLLEDEVQQICGERYERDADREASRHGTSARGPRSDSSHPARDRLCHRCRSDSKWLHSVRYTERHLQTCAELIRLIGLRRRSVRIGH